jgi:hypothetical protein
VDERGGGEADGFVTRARRGLVAEGALRTAGAGSVSAQGRRVSELSRREQARGGRGRLLAEAVDRREATFEGTKRFRRVDG